VKKQENLYTQFAKCQVFTNLYKEMTAIFSDNSKQL